MPKRIGRYTIMLTTLPSIIGNAGVVGKKEGEGPLANEFDKIHEDEFLGKDTFEKAESELIKDAVSHALSKANITPEDIDCCFSGDLLNQCIGSSFALREFGFPFSGLYGACSTMALSLALSSTLIDSGALNIAVAATSSHFCSAERQYRNPLEYGGQRSPASQWTVTGAGAAVVKNDDGDNPKIAAVTFGKIRDLGITDANNMGAAMAPSAAETISTFMSDTHTKPEDFDLILTGDLGKVGSRLLRELLFKENNIDISQVHNDCGTLIYDLESQDVHSGGSGCGCSASVVCSYIINKLRKKELNRVLFVGTGALLSPTSSLQGESIPGISHAVLLTSSEIK
ncbi:MAG: stage V sporulation protein AD [Clostridia bacterium]|nr:stage V sporulation protein AD [Clostridia bacterium]